MALANPAAAQTATAVAPAETTPIIVHGLPEVVVVARRYSERQQKVPVAVTALSGAELKRRGISNTNDLAQAVPSLYVGGQQRNNSEFYLRGTSPGVIYQGVHNPSSVVAYYLEVPTQISGPGVFYDLSSVEVLKGPQGTLFGRNTTGGAILFNPVLPGPDWTGYLQGRVGNYNDREGEGGFNLPIVPNKLEIRVSGAIARRDGFTDNVTTGQKLDDRDYDAYRVSIDMQPVESIDNLLVLDGRYINQNGTSSIPVEFNTNNATSPILAEIPGLNLPVRVSSNTNRPSIFCLEGALAGYSFGSACPSSNLGTLLGLGLKAGGFSFYPQSELNAILAEQRKLGPRQFASDAIYMDQERATNATDTLKWYADPDLTVKNIFGYRFNRVNIASDFAGTDIPFVRNLNNSGNYGEDALEQISEEMQAQGNAINGKLKYVFGVYFENATPGQNTDSNVVQFGPPLSFKAANPAGYAYLTNQSQSLEYKSFNDTSISTFAHGEYDLGNLLDGLKFAGGARNNWDERNQTQSIYAPNGTTCKTGSGVCPITDDGFFRAPTWNVVLSEQISATWLTYGSISRGYQSGGGNLPALTNSDGKLIDENFKAEYITSYEIGSKVDYSVMGIHARTNAAIFYDNYRDLQIALGTISDNQLVTEVHNVPQATLEGVEIEQTIAPFENFTLSGYFSWVKAIFSTDYLLNGLNVDNRQLPYTPTFKYGAYGTYTVPLAGELGKLAFSASWSHQDHVMTLDNLDPMDYFKGYDLVNVRADWSGVYNKPLDLALVVNNAANSTYVSGGYPLYSQVGFQSRIYGEPRMIYGQVTVHWGPNAKW